MAYPFGKVDPKKKALKDWTKLARDKKIPKEIIQKVKQRAEGKKS